jgi:hypothetical protein
MFRKKTKDRLIKLFAIVGFLHYIKEKNYFMFMMISSYINSNMKGVTLDDINLDELSGAGARNPEKPQIKSIVEELKISKSTQQKANKLNDWAMKFNPKDPSI